MNKTKFKINVRDIPFNEWLKDFDRRFAKCNEYFKAVFDFMDMKLEQRRPYKR